MRRTFDGYLRSNGKVGTRNYLALIPTVFCVNEVVERLGALVPGTRALRHQHGCCELKPDLDRITRVLCGLIENPNVGGCVIISLGCEGVQAAELLAAARNIGKPALYFTLQDVGGLDRTIEACLEPTRQLKAALDAQPRVECDLSQLVLGIKCGSSDATSGLAANPAVGSAVDRLIDARGAVLFGETTELLGAEHILARRCQSPQIGQHLVEIVERLEKRVAAAGVDMRGSQPTPGNIAGGITTIEEKSLGAICKSGSRPISEVLEYAEPTPGPGLFVMDSPGKEDEIMTGLAAAGANLIAFATGGGAPQGFPLIPVIKVASNEQKCAKMHAHIDVDASGILRGTESVEAVGQRIFELLPEIASGQPVQAERIGYDRTIGIWLNTAI